MPRTRALKKKAADCPSSPSSVSPSAPPTGTPVPKITLVMKKPAPTDPAPTNEPTTAHPTPPEPAAEPLAASADSKKARAKKAVTKEPISYMLLIRVTCGGGGLSRSPIWSACRNRKARLAMGRNCKAESSCSCQAEGDQSITVCPTLRSRAEVVAEGRGNTA